MSLFKEFSKGLYAENPVFRLMLGLCPTLATSTSVNNALGMGVSTTFVLVCSNVVISLIRKTVPSKIRIPVFIMVIATFVTIVDLVMAGFFPMLHKSLGIFINLIVVNCIIMGRAEAFASKRSIFVSLIDGIGMGVGFTLSIMLIASIREILGNGTWMGFSVMASTYRPVLLMILSPGAFFTIGFLMGFLAWLQSRSKRTAA